LTTVYQATETLAVLKGHGFSRAANVKNIRWALAPEGMQAQ
jgi:hypothetical protein